MIKRTKKQPGLGINRTKKQGNKETAKKQLNKGDGGHLISNSVMVID